MLQSDVGKGNSCVGISEKESWRPWTLDNCQRMGGYITRYQNNFDFLTIRGAGHMVPQTKSRAALSFFRAARNFLN